MVSVLKKAGILSVEGRTDQRRMEDLFRRRAKYRLCGIAGIGCGPKEPDGCGAVARLRASSVTNVMRVSSSEAFSTKRRSRHRPDSNINCRNHYAV